MMAVAALVGCVMGAIPAMLPGVHIYSLLAPLMLFLYQAPDSLHVWGIPLVSGMVTSWSILNTIPSVLLGAPDESALLTVLPGQRRLMAGRGMEAVLLIGAGSVGSLLLLLAITAPLSPGILPVIRAVTQPHLHWMIWVIISFMLLSEWPKKGDLDAGWWRRLTDAWSTLLAGIATFLLSGALGWILLSRSPVAIHSAFQNLMPAFTGLFAVPWCLLNAVAGAPVPPQTSCRVLPVDTDHLLRGVVAGWMGGSIASFLPAVTGGVGGMLAGHACAQRDERVFLVAQGACKTVYYAGALVLFFTPQLHLTRGGAAWMLQGVVPPSQPGGYLLALGSIALAGGVACLLLEPLSLMLLRVTGCIDARRISLFSLAWMGLLVFLLTGFPGLFIAVVASGIGLLPVLYGSRRLNCLGILLLPIACNL